VPPQLCDGSTIILTFLVVVIVVVVVVVVVVVQPDSVPLYYTSPIPGDAHWDNL